MWFSCNILTKNFIWASKHQYLMIYFFYFCMGKHLLGRFLNKTSNTTQINQNLEKKKKNMFGNIRAKRMQWHVIHCIISLLFWRLLPVPHIFSCSSIGWTTILCIDTAPPNIIIYYSTILSQLILHKTTVVYNPH